MTAGVQVTTPITSGSITSSTNNVTITSGAFSTGGATGVQIAVYLSCTPSATSVITAKLWQGSTAGSGTQVGPVAGLLATLTGTTQDTKSFVWVDTSAFAQNATNATYTVGFTGNTGTNTVVYAHMDIETIGPVN